MENKNPDKWQILLQVTQELSCCVTHSPCFCLSLALMARHPLPSLPLKPKKIPWHTAKELISRRKKAHNFAFDNCFLDWNIRLNKRIFHTGKVWKLSSLPLPRFNQYNPGLTSQAQKKRKVLGFPRPTGNSAAEGWIKHINSTVDPQRSVGSSSSIHNSWCWHIYLLLGKDEHRQTWHGEELFPFHSHFHSPNRKNKKRNRLKKQRRD